MTATTKPANGSAPGSQQDMEVDATPLPKIVVLPMRYTKVLHLIRHGEGYHNVAGHKDVQLYKSWEYFDSHLNTRGWQQAHALGEKVRKDNLRVDVVVTSPMTRALETAVGVFGLCTPAEADTKPLLMLEQTREEGKRAAHPAVTSHGVQPFVACELCREHLGVHPCDKRRTLTHYRTNFPAVDFSGIETEDDVLWQETYRESKEEMQERGLLFLRWVLQRPEQNIAVVSHSSFLHHLLLNFGTDASEHVQAELHKWFLNCELRSIAVSDVMAV